MSWKERVSKIGGGGGGAGEGGRKEERKLRYGVSIDLEGDRLT